MKRIDISGLRYGRLLVISYAGVAKNGGSMWLCRCDCGKEAAFNSGHLRHGGTKSCGCLLSEWASSMGANRDFIAIRSERAATHGHKRKSKVSVEYKTWLGMKRRCYDEKFKDYPNWGGRGIRVCERWLHSFVNFLEDMGPRPAGKYSIDRKESDKDYSPENCRWATVQEQGAENRRGLTKIEIDGVLFHSIGHACRHFGVKLTTAHYRIKAGIPIELAVTQSDRLPSRRDKESYLRKDRRSVA